MILFFDRSVGVRLPTAPEALGLPVEVTWHEKHFSPDEQDDVWLPRVGLQGWTVIGHDHNYHNNTSELAALKKYDIGTFYMWGSEAVAWEKLRVFARAYDKIVLEEGRTQRSFLFRTHKNGRVVQDYLPWGVPQG